MEHWKGIALLALGSVLCAPSALAFPGAIAASSRAELEGAVVVALRDGGRTVITLEVHTRARGPLALVLPLPASVQADAVETLEPAVLDKLDLMTAPRLVQYTERDPCASAEASTLPEQLRTSERAAPAVATETAEPVPVDTDEIARPTFSVEVLEPHDASALVSHLQLRSLSLHEAVVSRLTQRGVTQRYLIAHMDVPAEEGSAERGGSKHRLPPIRFVMDTDALELPLMIGRSAQTVPVTLHVISQGTRFELSRRTNVVIPTNLVVTEAALGSFAPFYEALSDRMLQRYPRSGLTEYAWPATRCAPCPASALSADDLEELGAQLLPSHEDASAGTETGEPESSYWDRFVGTRIRLELHPGESTPLSLRPSDPITGGDGVPRGERGELSPFAERDMGANAFQARYLVLQKWPTLPTCEAPVRGVWIGPADDAPPARTAGQLAFANAEPGELNTFLEQGLPARTQRDVSRDGDVYSGDVQPAPTAEEEYEDSEDELASAESYSTCGHCAVGSDSTLAPLAWLALLGLVALRRRRRG